MKDTKNIKMQVGLFILSRFNLRISKTKVFKHMTIFNR